MFANNYDANPFEYNIVVLLSPIPLKNHRGPGIEMCLKTIDIIVTVYTYTHCVSRDSNYITLYSNVAAPRVYIVRN